MEDSRALSLLCELGCDIAQDYYVGRPLAMAELPAWMATHGPDLADQLAAMPEPADVSAPAGAGKAGGRGGAAGGASITPLHRARGR